MAKHRTEKFPLESFPVIPGHNLVVEFRPSVTGEPVLRIHDSEGRVFISCKEFQEIIKLADGRMFNNLNLQLDSKSSADEDQMLAALRDNERLVMSLLYQAHDQRVFACKSPQESTIIMAALVLAMKVLRDNRQPAE